MDVIDAGRDWSPEQYHRFAAQRTAPFHDLVALVQRDRPIARMADLGCGSGELTAYAKDALGVPDAVGVDSSPAMLAAAAAHAGPSLRFQAGDIAGWTSPADHDLVLANASLQWVPDHHAVLEPEAYAALLHDLGFVHQHVRLQVYPHLLPESRSVVDWVRGTTLTRFQKVMPADVFAQFVAEYEQRLLEVIGEASPYFFPFRRILLWGRLG